MTTRARHRFKLYVADNAPNSVRAVANLKAFCREYLPDRHDIEIIDVLKEPKRALAELVFMTPTLVRLAPAPLRKIIGTLSDIAPLLAAFGLEARAPAA